MLTLKFKSSLATLLPFPFPSGSHGNRPQIAKNRVKIAPCPVFLQSVSMGTGREGNGGWVARLTASLHPPQLETQTVLARWSSGLQTALGSSGTTSPLLGGVAEKGKLTAGQAVGLKPAVDHQTHTQQVIRLRKHPFTKQRRSLSNQGSHIRLGIRVITDLVSQHIGGL